MGVEERGIPDLLGTLEGGDNLDYPEIGRRVILKWVLKKWDGAWTGLIWLKIGSGGGLL
jgi:hypothetical protein